MYIRRPVTDKYADFAADSLRKFVGDSRHYVPRKQLALSLATGSDVRALRRRGLLGGMSAKELEENLLDALPETSSYSCSAQLGEVALLEDSRRRRLTLAVTVCQSDIRTERSAITSKFRELGGVDLWEGEIGPHISFGTFDKEPPERILKEFEACLSDALYLERVHSTTRVP